MLLFCLMFLPQCGVNLSLLSLAEDTSPCSDTAFNELTAKGKDLLNGLFDSAQVSRSQPANMLFALFVSLTISMHRAWV